MQVVIMAVFIDDGDGAKQTAPRRNPLDELIERMRREMKHGRASVNERKADGSQVA